MPLFTGRVGPLSHHYSIPRSAYYTSSTTGDEPKELVFLNVSSLSTLKLPFDSRTPLITYTIWEYALRHSNSFVMPSLSSVKRKIGDALQMVVREDEEFWRVLVETGDKIIIFENPHWFWGRYRAGQGEYWSGRNELGELLMLVRESHRSSLARLMPLAPFPLSTPIPSPSSVVGGSTAVLPPLPSPLPRRPLSMSMPGSNGQRSLSTMDRIPSGPFSRLVGPSASPVEGSFSPLFGHTPSDIPTFGRYNEPTISPNRGGVSMPHPPSSRQPTLSLRSPRSSISSSGFSPPPPYMSNPGSPTFPSSFNDGFMPTFGEAPRYNVPGTYRPQSDPLPVRRNGQGMYQPAQTLPHRLRGINVDEDLERQALNRLREDYYRQQHSDIDGRNLERVDDPLAALRAANARRLNRSELADVQRKLREAERIKANAQAILDRRRSNIPSHPHQLNPRSFGAPELMHPNQGCPRELQAVDQLGAKRARELEERIVAHRRAMRNVNDQRRERDFAEIERLQRNGVRTRRSSVPFF